MFASPWSAPAWMKSNNLVYGEGYLLPEYYESWANYFVKFLDSYKGWDLCCVMFDLTLHESKD